MLLRVKYMIPSTCPPPCTLSYCHFSSIKAETLARTFRFKKKPLCQASRNSLYSGYSLREKVEGNIMLLSGRLNQMTIMKTRRQERVGFWGLGTRPIQNSLFCSRQI